MTFPCDFPIKIMGKNSPDFTEKVLTIVRRHFPGFGNGHLKQNTSDKMNYLSLTVTVHAESKEQLDALYRDLSANPEILVAL